MTAALSGCRQVSSNDHVPVSIAVSSGSFRQGETIPDKFTCSAANVSPTLSWSGLPPRTQSLALLVTDPDSLFGSYVHWVVYDLPPTPNQIPEAVPRSKVLPGRGRQGINGGDTAGYTGPCPPGKSSHRYVFTVYALDAFVYPASPVDKKQLMKAMQGHVLATGQLIGHYHR